MTMQPIGSPGVRPNTLHDQTAPNTLHGVGSAGGRPAHSRPGGRPAAPVQRWSGAQGSGATPRRTSRSRSAGASTGRARLVIPSWVYMAALALILFFFYLLQGAPTA